MGGNRGSDNIFHESDLYIYIYTRIKIGKGGMVKTMRLSIKRRDINRSISARNLTRERIILPAHDLRGMF